jgi:DNA-binding CsgD family transcriptional regulator
MRAVGSPGRNSEVHGSRPPGGEDRRTARLLHAVLACDVAALLTVGVEVTSLRLTTWADDGGPVVHRPWGGRALQAEVTTRLARSLAPFRSHRELVVAPTAGGSTMRFLMVVPVAVEPGRSTAWLLGRGQRGFSADEEDHAGLLAPGLRMRTVGAEAPGPCVGTAALTRRELQVLELVGGGATAGAVAHYLGISHRTVQKHLEHVYAKLGCQDRLSAVLRVRDAGLLQDGAAAAARVAGPRPVSPAHGPAGIPAMTDR